jgi:hypothetical protein
MKNKSVTIVSCYYKINSKRSHEQYCTFISNLLNNLNNNIVIYTSDEQYDFLSKFKKDCIKIIIKNYEEINLFKQYKNILENQYQMDNQKYTGRTKECYVLWNSKLDFLKETIELNPFSSDKFIWIDIGSVRTSDIIKYLMTFPIYDNVSNEKIDIVCIQNFSNHNQKFFRDEIHLGGLYGGGIECILKFHELFYKKFQEYLENNQFIGCDQQIISSIYLENKDLFNVIDPYTNSYTENGNLVPHQNNIDVWFYLLYYYSFNK